MNTIRGFSENTKKIPERKITNETEAKLTLRGIFGGNFIRVINLCAMDLSNHVVTEMPKAVRYI